MRPSVNQTQAVETVRDDRTTGLVRLDVRTRHPVLPALVAAPRNTPVITVIEPPQGFVEPRVRGTLRKMAVAGVLAAFFAVASAFLLEYRRHVRSVDGNDYDEFVVRRRKVASD